MRGTQAKSLIFSDGCHSRTCAANKPNAQFTRYAEADLSTNLLPNLSILLVSCVNWRHGTVDNNVNVFHCLQCCFCEHLCILCESGSSLAVVVSVQFLFVCFRRQHVSTHFLSLNLNHYGLRLLLPKIWASMRMTCPDLICLTDFCFSDALSTSVNVLLDGKESTLDFIDTPSDQVRTFCGSSFLLCFPLKWSEEPSADTHKM